MAKSKEKIKALKLREEKGLSIKQIAQRLGVSKGTVSLWCRDIALTPEQIEKLHKQMVKGSYAGRLLGSQAQHKNRLERENEARKKALNDIGSLSDKELLIALSALYWGEGRKSQRTFFISNSDPEMIRFILKAYERVLKVNKDRIIMAVGLNFAHKARDEEVKQYWSAFTGIPLSQFRKTIFIKAKNKKVYKNFSNHYGTLRITVKKSVDLYYRTMGLIEALQKVI